jgi:hypothetical protein
MGGYPTYGMPCMVCGYVTEERDGFACTTQGCPCYGTVPGTREAGIAAATWQQDRVRYAERIPQRPAGRAMTMSGAEARALMRTTRGLDAMGVVEEWLLDGDQIDDDIELHDAYLRRTGFRPEWR